MIGPKYDRPKKPTPAEERVIYEGVTFRDGGVCVKCLRRHPIHGVNRDHRQGRGRGGITRPSDLQLLCGSGTTGCHGWKTNNPREATRQGYTVPSRIEPSDWPARRFFATGRGTQRLGWCLYSDDYQVTEISDDEARARMGDFYPDTDELPTNEGSEQ